jgi:hypothetical protein
VDEVYEEPVVDVVQVRPLHYVADSRREYTVIGDDSGNAWLLKTDEMPGNVEFELTATELASLPKPYKFTKELRELMPTNQDMQQALWLKGIITKDDLQDVESVANALARAFPSAQAFARFGKGDA